VLGGACSDSPKKLNRAEKGGKRLAQGTPVTPRQAPGTSSSGGKWISEQEGRGEGVPLEKPLHETLKGEVTPRGEEEKRKKEKKGGLKSFGCVQALRGLSIQTPSRRKGGGDREKNSARGPKKKRGEKNHVAFQNAAPRNRQT